MKKLALITLAVFILGCKNETRKQEESNNGTPTEEISETNQNFEMSLAAIVEQSDSFRLFYLLGEEKEITRKNSVGVDVTGSEDAQVLTFKLPVSDLPTRLVLKYGNEEKTQRIHFKNMQMTYEGREVTIKGERFWHFFNPNEFIEYDRENAIATSAEKDGKYTPTFYSRDVLEQKIDANFY